MDYCKGKGVYLGIFNETSSKDIEFIEHSIQGKYGPNPNRRQQNKGGM